MKFKYDPFINIITGDLNIDQDRGVINFMRKELKYRPPPKINLESEVIAGALSSYYKHDGNGRNQTKSHLFLFKPRYAYC